MSSAELTEWLAYSELEPFGPEAEDLRWARQAVLTAEPNRNKKKRGRPFTVREFQFVEYASRRISEPKEIIGLVRAFAAAGIGRIEEN